jgi:mono/diheme cytochrome c family protein
MKISKQRLYQIIKEELLKEGFGDWYNKWFVRKNKFMGLGPLVGHGDDKEIDRKVPFKRKQKYGAVSDDKIQRGGSTAIDPKYRHLYEPGGARSKDSDMARELGVPPPVLSRHRYRKVPSSQFMGAHKNWDIFPELPKDRQAAGQAAADQIFAQNPDGTRPQFDPSVPEHGEGMLATGPLDQYYYQKGHAIGLGARPNQKANWLARPLDVKYPTSRTDPGETPDPRTNSALVAPHWKWKPFSQRVATDDEVSSDIEGWTPIEQDAGGRWVQDLEAGGVTSLERPGPEPFGTTCVNCHSPDRFSTYGGGVAAGVGSSEGSKDTTSPEEKEARGVTQSRGAAEFEAWGGPARMRHAEEKWKIPDDDPRWSIKENIKRKSAKDTIILERWNKIIK